MTEQLFSSLNPLDSNTGSGIDLSSLTNSNTAEQTTSPTTLSYIQSQIAKESPLSNVYSPFQTGLQKLDKFGKSALGSIQAFAEEQKKRESEYQKLAAQALSDKFNQTQEELSMAGVGAGGSTQAKLGEVATPEIQQLLGQVSESRDLFKQQVNQAFQSGVSNISRQIDKYNDKIDTWEEEINDAVSRLKSGDLSSKKAKQLFEDNEDAISKAEKRRKELESMLRDATSALSNI